jgi:RimJ/RimL family protein N-acetyltransferase
MAALTTVNPFPHTHKEGHSLIELSKNENGHLRVVIQTEKLLLRSVTVEDITDYAGLFGNSEVMEKYSTGTPVERNAIAKRITDSWVKRWQDADPYSGLAVFEKASGNFVGHTVLGYGDRPGQSEFAFLFHKAYWHKGYGTDTVRAIQEYARVLIKEKFLLEEKPLEEVRATSRQDNKWAVRIFEHAGWKKIEEIKKYGSDSVRNLYLLSLKEKPVS